LTLEAKLKDQSGYFAKKNMQNMVTLPCAFAIAHGKVLVFAVCPGGRHMADIQVFAVCPDSQHTANPWMFAVCRAIRAHGKHAVNGG